MVRDRDRNANLVMKRFEELQSERNLDSNRKKRPDPINFCVDGGNTNKRHFNANGEPIDEGGLDEIVLAGHDVAARHYRW